MASRWANNVNGSSRARRFAIQMPIHYRRSGEIGWHEGQVENISRSGVLFQARQLMDLQALLDLSFELPVEIGGEAGAAVVCRGEVVRRVPPATTDAPAALATRILEYHFTRGRNGYVA